MVKREKAKKAASSLINYAFYVAGAALSVGGGYFLWTKFVKHALSVRVSPTTITAGQAMSYWVTGATPNGQGQLALIWPFNNRTITPDITFNASGQINSGGITTSETSGIATGTAQLRVTDITTGAVAQASFTVI